VQEPAVQIAALVIAAVAATWIAGRLRLPSILLLLAVGILVGPVFGIADPDALLGDLVSPAVSLAVGIILFEGGLSLRLREVEGQHRVI
jgi:NhaP-type Na+/H+ or K+/H+ antiporter